MENTIDQTPDQEQAFRENLKNALSGFMDKLLAQAGMLAETAGEILRNAVPNVVPWPKLGNIKSLMHEIVQFRQRQPAPVAANPHIPRHFGFIRKGHADPNRVPNHLRLRQR